VFIEQQFKVAKHCDRQSAYTQSILYGFKHQLLESSKVVFSAQKEKKIYLCTLLSTSIIA